MTEEPLTVYTVANPIEAEIIKNYLHSEGIWCAIEGENQAGEVGLTAFEIKIQVRPTDYDRARMLIEEHEIHRRRREAAEEE